MTEDIKQNPRGLKGIMEDLKVNTFDELIDYMQKKPNGATCPGVGKSFK